MQLSKKLKDILANLAFNSLQPGVAFLYPPENRKPLGFLMFSRGIEKATPGCNGLNIFRIFTSCQYFRKYIYGEWKVYFRNEFIDFTKILHLKYIGQYI